MKRARVKALRGPRRSVLIKPFDLLPWVWRELHAEAKKDPKGNVARTVRKVIVDWAAAQLESRGEGRKPEWPVSWFPNGRED